MGEVENIMVELYNLTNLSSSSNIYEMTLNANVLTGGWLGFLILLSFFIILVVSFNKQDMITRISAASFITTLATFLFRIIGFTTDLIVTLFVLVTALSFVFAQLRKD